MVSELNPMHKEILTHMLGAGGNYKKSLHGYRNHFCAEVGGLHHAMLMELLAAGLVTAGRAINDGRDQYFHATTTGCEAIGLNKKAIQRAMED